MSARAFVLRASLVALLLALALVGACSKKDQGTQTVMRENAFVVDEGASEGATVGSSSVTFPRAGNESLLQRKPGDVLVGRRASSGTGNPYGFLRRVRSIASGGDTIVVETDPATLEDAYAQAEFSAPTVGKHAVSTASLHAPLSPRDEGDDPTIGDFDLGRHFTFDVGGVHGKVVPSGTFHFNPSYDDIHGRIGWDGLQDAAFVIGGDVHAALTLDVWLDDVQAGAQNSWTLAQASIPLIIPDPPIEITALIRLNLTCSVKAELRHLHAQFGAALDLNKVAFGIKYDKTNGWRGVNDFDATFHRIGPLIEAEGDVDVQCSIGPKLSLLIYDVAGPFVSIAEYAKVRLELLPKCKIDLFAGFTGEVGLEADIPILHTKIGSFGIPFKFGEQHLYDGPEGDCTGPSLVSVAYGSPAPPLADFQNHPGRLSTDETFVYWTDLGTPPDFLDGTVQRTHLDGTDPLPTVLESGQAHPNAVAVDDGSIYWTEHASCDDPDAFGDVRKANKDGSGNHVLVAQQDEPGAIAVDATHVYWLSTAESPHGAVMRADKDGSNVVVLAHGLDSPLGLALDENYVYWTEYGSGSDTGSATSVGDGRVARVAKTGGPMQVIAVGELAPSGVVADLVNVYWADAGSAGGGSIRFAPKASTAKAATFAEGQNMPFGVAVDGTYLYWSTMDALVRAPKDRSADPIRIAIEKQEPLSLALVPSTLTDVAHDLVFSTSGTHRPEDVDLGDGEILDLGLSK